MKDQWKVIKKISAQKAKAFKALERNHRVKMKSWIKVKY